MEDTKVLETAITAEEEKEAPENFQRLRRITGYLSELNTRFNDAKKAECNDRVKHTLNIDFTDDNKRGAE